MSWRRRAGSCSSWTTSERFLASQCPQSEYCRINTAAERLSRSMEHFTFGRNNGLRVSALALGAGSFGSRWGYGAEPDDIPKIFDRFADAGGTFIDTAASYQLGEAEENLGSLLDGRRDSFTIATKFAIGGPEGNGVLQTGNGRRAMFRSVEGSLRRLGTDYIDLLWVHFPDLVTPIEEIVGGLDDLAR